MRFQPTTVLAAALLVALAASSALANPINGTINIMVGLLPARSRARVLAFSCSPADITSFAAGASRSLGIASPIPGAIRA